MFQRDFASRIYFHRNILWRNLSVFISNKTKGFHDFFWGPRDTEDSLYSAHAGMVALCCLHRLDCKIRGSCVAVLILRGSNILPGS